LLRFGRSNPLGDTNSAPGGEPPVNPRLEKLTAQSWAVLLFERIWRAILPPLVVAGAFVSLSWTGIWLDAPSWVRGLGIALTALGLFASLLPARKFRWPTRKEAVDRIDEASGLSLRPAASLADRLGNGEGNPVTVALWNLHRRRAERAMALLRTGAPSPRAAELDRYALRAVVFVALIATGFVAGPQRYARLAAAFDWRFAAPGDTVARVDAWIDPPAYTGKTPILLNLSRGQSFFEREDSPQLIAAPAGSIVVIHAPAGKLAIEVKGGLANLATDSGSGARANADAGARLSAAAPKGQTESRLILRGDAALTIRDSGVRLGTFDIRAILDNPPSIALTAAPKFNLRGSFTLKYRVSDDYGVTSAEAVFAKPVLPGGRLATRSLVEPPRVPLTLLPPLTPSGEAATTIDLSDHPWAGARAEMTLTAHDEGGNEGSSAGTEISLPQKPFANPVARALAEQRRALVLTPDDKARVAHALEALMIAPDSFGTSAGVYLGLRVALDRLNAAQGDDDLIEVAGLLWQMAELIESGDLSAAERDLRAAEKELREAMQRGAGEEEIRKLSENLRAAMDKFLQQLAAQQNDSSRSADPAGRYGQDRLIRPEDLQRMVDDLRAMLRSGDRAGAQKMLDQLQDVLENLKFARPRQPNPRAQELSRALDDLGRLSQDQQDLRDETYASGQQERWLQRGEREDAELAPGLTFGDIFGQSNAGRFGQSDRGSSEIGQSKSGQSPPAGENNAADFARRQKALRDRVESLQSRLKEAAGGDLGEAKDAMIAAENALRQGPHGNGAAVEAQGRAIEALREGAQKLAESMGGQGEGTGPGGEDEAQGAPGQFGAPGGSDPLGRPAGRDDGYANFPAGYDPAAASPAERARLVLEELRRRIGEPARPREEMDYLERLLRRY
jgi:uncharacterized protein (TIGR02302 family)